jgi:hypothetical protein
MSEVCPGAWCDQIPAWPGDVEYIRGYKDALENVLDLLMPNSKGLFAVVCGPEYPEVARAPHERYWSRRATGQSRSMAAVAAGTSSEQEVASTDPTSVEDGDVMGSRVPRGGQNSDYEDEMRERMEMVHEVVQEVRCLLRSVETEGMSEQEAEEERGGGLTGEKHKRYQRDCEAQGRSNRFAQGEYAGRDHDYLRYGFEDESGEDIGLSGNLFDEGQQHPDDEDPKDDEVVTIVASSTPDHPSSPIPSSSPPPVCAPTTSYSASPLRPKRLFQTHPSDTSFYDSFRRASGVQVRGQVEEDSDEDEVDEQDELVGIGRKRKADEELGGEKGREAEVDGRARGAIGRKGKRRV